MLFSWLSRHTFLMFVVFAAGCATPTKQVELSTANGISELAKGNQLFAKSAFENQCSRNERRACLELGKIFNKKGDRVNAQQNFSKSCDLGNQYGCFKLGELYFKSGEIAKAKPLLRKSCDKIHWSCQYLGIILESEGETAESNKIYEEQCKSNHPKGCILRGMAAEYSGRHKTANKWYKRGCKLSPLSCAFQSITEILVGNREKGFRLAEKDCPNGGSKTCRIAKQYRLVKKSPSIVQMWKRECDSNNAESCYQLGLFQSLNLKTMKISKKTLRKACDLGNGFGCIELGNFLNRYRDHKKYSKLKEEACRKGAGPACSLLSDGSFPYQVADPETDSYQEGCSKGDGRACNQIARKNWSIDKTKAKTFYRKACDLKYLDGCYWADQLENGDNTPDTMKSLCYRGHTRSCAGYGDALRKAKNTDGAVRYYKKACSGQSQRACYWLAELKSQNDPNFKKDRELKSLCDGGYNFACYKIGEALYKSGSSVEAKKFLSKGCDRSDGDSCGYLGYMAFKSDNKTEAKKWYRIGCDYGDAYSCRNL